MRQDPVSFVYAAAAVVADSAEGIGRCFAGTAVSSGYHLNPPLKAGKRKMVVGLHLYLVVRYESVAGTVDIVGSAAGFSGGSSVVSAAYSSALLLKVELR